jgi:hypothetical protein
MPDPKLPVKEIAVILAQAALDRVAETADYVPEEDVKTAAKKVEAVVKQDAPAKSLRVWSAVASGFSTVLVGALVTGLMDPAVGDAIRQLITDYTGPFAPVLVAVLPAMLAMLSKYRDPRPTR